MSDTGKLAVRVLLTNSSSQTLRLSSYRYVEGTVYTDDFWSDIGPQGTTEIRSEFANGYTGCKGYATYCLQSRKPFFTLAFANMGQGRNMVALGSDASATMNELSSYDFKPVSRVLSVGDASFDFSFQCTGGDVNNITVYVEEKIGASS